MNPNLDWCENQLIIIYIADSRCTILKQLQVSEFVIGGCGYVLNVKLVWKGQVFVDKLYKYEMIVDKLTVHK